MSVDAYGWDAAVIDQLLALCLKSPDFYPRWRRAIRPEHFPDDAQAAVVAVLDGLVGQYGQVPTEPVMRAELDRALHASSEPHRKRVTKALDRGYATQPKDVGWLRDNAVEFGRRLALRRAIERAAKIVATGNPDDILQAVTEAHALGEDGGDEPHFVRAAAREHFEAWPHRTASGIPTGYAMVDRALDGGAQPGELYTVMADAKAGKTTLLVNLMWHAMRAGIDCAYYTLEVGQARIADRLYCRAIRRHKDWVRDNPRKAHHLFQRVTSLAAGEAAVQQYATGGMSVAGLRASIQTLVERRGFAPRALFVDYADLLAPDRQADGDQWYQSLNAIFRNLRGLAVDLRIPVWTATQTNRTGGVAGSYEKLAIVDAMFLLQRNENVTSLTAARVRNAAGGQTIELDSDADTYVMEEKKRSPPPTPVAGSTHSTPGAA